MQLDKEFTINKAIEIQKKHLRQWKAILKEEVYSDLEKWATKTNTTTENPYHIRRGMSLDNFIKNHSCYINA